MVREASAVESDQSHWPGPDSVELDRPDDWHLHLRDGAMLARVLPFTSRVFGRAIVMPNLDPPVATVAEALAYRDRILKAVPAGDAFEPLMTLYLTPEMTADEIARAAESSAIAAVKFYPKGATTNSSRGVDALASLDVVLSALERHDLPLLVHGETTDPDCDVFDRERVFLDETLRPLASRYAGLRIVFEHITTAEAAAFVSEMPARIGATITPQHLLMNRNAIFEGGLRPHHYCLPVLKREADREALVQAATSGDPSFFLGTDSAPHEVNAKESACGCAGIFSAPVALETYAEAFLQAGRLDRLEGFASHFGPDFYRLPRNAERVRLERQAGHGPPQEGRGPEALAVFWAERTLHYRLTSDERRARGL